MTGHGVGEAPLGEGRVVVEIRAVNHRYLDARVRMPAEIIEQSALVEEEVRRSLRRGRIEVSCRLEGGLAAQAVLHMPRARAAFRQLSELRDELQPGEPVPLSLLLSVPNLFDAERLENPEAVQKATRAATRAACEAVWSMRENEGRALAEDLGRQLAQLEALLAAVQAKCPQIAKAYREKLLVRIESLLADSEVTLDPGRLEHEVALFADRSDVAEEITRLLSHCRQMHEILEASNDEASGKRIDFLLQEMSRETNTIGSKCSNADLAQLVVEMKVNLSRMREQTQNVL